MASSNGIGLDLSAPLNESSQKACVFSTPNGGPFSSPSRTKTPFAPKPPLASRKNIWPRYRESGERCPSLGCLTNRKYSLQKTPRRTRNSRPFAPKSSKRDTVPLPSSPCFQKRSPLVGWRSISTISATFPRKTSPPFRPSPTWRPSLSRIRSSIKRLRWTFSLSPP